MTRSPIRGSSFAAIALAVGASVAVLAVVAAWERTSVRVYAPTPAEGALLLRAGDVVGPTVELGADLFEERVEKRIESFGRAVLEYHFAAKDTGVEVRSLIIERPGDELAQEELQRQQQAFGGVPIDPYAGSGYAANFDLSEQPVPQVLRKGNKFQFAATWGTYVYVLEMTPDFASEVDVAAAMQAKMRELDRPGSVLPLRAPLMAAP